jgi:two-component system, chemotaxis family, protein-glutamate methylesterase/glutaminase
MEGLPERLPPDGIDVFSGLVCPDCRGSLAVRLHRGHPAFTCRVGHSFSTDELIAGKESALESRMWEAVYAFEELSVLLADLDRHHLAEGVGAEGCRQRAAQAKEQAVRLRSIIQVDRPVTPRVSASHGHDPAVPS